MSTFTPQPSICVYCGSRPGAQPAYMDDATTFGTALAGEGWRLVYGAGDVGIMGAVARAAQAAGGDTFGVIPTHLMQLEVGKRDLTRFVVTENMHERKKVMFMNSDAIVVLPGGAGSLDEFFEVLTWAQLGLHAKPILLVNTNGYWDPLTGLVDHVIAQGFADASLREFITVVDGPAAAIATLRDALSRDTADTE
ncbi:LOG family protein [Marimonas lutisalis]|uniref:LOG family protein n=1 Tax=Marimonas lutisalis TaxID=2545756 RepID=UPI0010F4E01E|nr:TIGR00730 family Rossman fold protein [Marimonas lutisalis]